MKNNPLLSANLRPRIQPDVIIHVTRKLGGPGKLKVRVGQEVSPDEILGSSLVSAGFFTINLAKNLGVSKEAAGKFMQKKVGTNIYKGELLALKKNLFGEKIVTAPTDGVVEEYSKETGILRIKYFPKKENLASGVYGIVDGINEASGECLIKTSGTQISGVAGVGAERSGFINLLEDKGALFNASLVKESLFQQILVVGALIYGQAFEKLVRMGASGVITGGVNASDFKALSGSFDPSDKQISRPNISVLVTEGFGSVPIGSDIYEQLKKQNGKFGFISGLKKRLLLPSTSGDSIIRIRKVALPINQWLDSQIDLGVRQLEIGMKVRIIWPPFAGWQGEIKAIDQASSALPSGISTFLVSVETKNHQIRVPFTNLEAVA